MNVQTLFRPAVARPSRVFLREPKREEAGEIGALLHSAFTTFQTSHGFGSDFATEDGATQFALAMIDDPMCYAVVALKERRIVGVNFLSESDPIRGVGPIAVATDADDSGIGRSLMHNIIERAGVAPGVRLLQDTFNLKSLALYTTLGFRTREPYVVVKGRLEDTPRLDRVFRPMEPKDLSSVAALSKDLTGFSRRGEVQHALSNGFPCVVLHEGRLTGYATDLGSWASGHAVAASEDDFRALVLGANALGPHPVQFLFPTRQSPLFRWLLSQGLRAEKQMMLMTRGSYRAPRGVYLPSVLY